MLKRIREEKTFRENMKDDIQEALSKINENNEEYNRNELEEQWLAELIQRKKLEQENWKDIDEEEEEVKQSIITKQNSKKYSIKEVYSGEVVVGDRKNDKNNETNMTQMAIIKAESISTLI